MKLFPIPGVSYIIGMIIPSSFNSSMILASLSISSSLINDDKTKTNLSSSVSLLTIEEASFNKTVDQGLSMLEELTKEGKTFSGEDAFKLYDTYGFPIDLTKDILNEKGIELDEARFKELMEEQKQKARNARKSSDGESWKSDGITFDNVAESIFVGYTENSCDTQVLDIVVENEHVDAAFENQKAIIVLKETPFYAESGGQVGDSGVIKTANGEFMVADTTKTTGGIITHFGTIKNGVISVGDTVSASIDVVRRDAIRRNHTAAHLLQAALRKVLGNHVEQAGQLVNEKAVRFDFTHFSALTIEELKAVEDNVNNAILNAITVENTEMPIDEAKKLGAMALFGEKYGDVVRVVNALGVSVELCGGTHVDNTSKLGLFHINSESSVAAGVRRIEAVTGANVLTVIENYIKLAADTADALKSTNINDIAKRADAVMSELKETQKNLEKAEAQLANAKMGSILDGAVEVGGIKVIAKELKGADANELRKMTDIIKADNSDAVAVFAGINGEKLTFCAACGKDAVAKGVHAGNLVREIAKLTGGNGGGKPDSAMAGGKDITQCDYALSKVVDIVKDQIG